MHAICWCAVPRSCQSHIEVRNSHRLQHALLLCWDLHLGCIHHTHCLPWKLKRWSVYVSVLVAACDGFHPWLLSPPAVSSPCSATKHASAPFSSRASATVAPSAPTDTRCLCRTSCQSKTSRWAVSTVGSSRVWVWQWALAASRQQPGCCHCCLYRYPQRAHLHARVACCGVLSALLFRHNDSGQMLQPVCDHTCVCACVACNHSQGCGMLTFVALCCRLCFTGPLLWHQ